MTLDDLHRTVQSAIPRVGKVVFIRYTIFGPEKTDIVAVLSHLAEAARTWTAQLPDRLHAVGSVTNGQVCVTLQFRGGATALLSFAQTPARADGVDLLILGNHGSLTCDTGPGPVELPTQRSDPKLQNVIERALRSGKPEPV